MKVSIIIPVYGVSDYIERCVKSVMNQTYDNIECIVVDDATPDASIVKCERLIAEYNAVLNEKTKGMGFRILHHEHNRGLSAARNTGTDAATGDYIFYLDSDDEITNDCIEKLVEPIKNDTTIEMVVGNYACNSHGNQILRKQQERDIDTLGAVRDFYFCKSGFCVNAWNKLVKREILSQYDISFKEGILWEDNLWTFFLLKYLNHIYIIPNVTYIYYIRPHSITTETDRERKVHHWKLMYGEIANHFTVGESGKEAKFYIKYFIFQMIRNQGGRDLYQVSQPYLKALHGDHYILEYLFYKIIVLLSRFGMGRSFLYFAVRKSMKYHKI